MKLNEISVKRPVAVCMVVLIFVVIGIYSLSMLPIDMMPEMELTYAMVYTSYSNVESQEVENLVTKTVEGAISSVSGIDSISSQSSEGASVISVSFNAGTDMDRAVADMKEKIELIEDYLPENCDKPTVMKLDTDMMSAAMMSVTYEGYDLIQTKKFIEDNVQGKLESVNGVASVSVMGASDRIIQVELSPQKLQGHNMNISSILTSIASQNQNLPSGNVDGMNKNMSVRTLGKFGTINDIKNVPLNTASGQILYLKDVANVSDTFSEITGYSRLNGEDSISITISAQSDANTVDVVNGLVDTLEKIKKQYPKFTYNMTMEQASYIEDAIDSVASNAITGGLLAVVILLLFLRNVKTSLTIGIAMPISVITTFIGMYFSGMTLNVVSLGGLALGVGMLVDNSVVVLENIFRRKKDLKENAATSAVKGSSEVFSAVVASVITTCIVYVPILFIDNIMAIMFKQLAFTIIFSQTASLIVTMLIIPMFTARIEDGDKPNQKLNFILEPFNRFMDFLYVKYKIILKKVLGHTKKFIIGVIAVFVLSIIVLSQLGMTLMPVSDEGTIAINVTLPKGTKLEDTNEISKKIETILLENKNTENVFSNIGSSGAMSAITGAGANTSSITVTLKDKRKISTEDVCQEFRKSLSNIAGAQISVEASGSGMSSMASNEISFQFTSSDDEKLTDFIYKAEKLLAEVDGVQETQTSISDTKNEVRVYIDSAKAAKYGLNTSQLSNLIRYTLDGTTASQFAENGSEYDIKLVYPKDYIKNYNNLKTMPIQTPTGQWITLSDVADINVEQGYSTLTRIDQKRVITLTGKLYNTNMAKANKDFENKLKADGIPEGISMNTSGSFEVMIDAMKSLFIAILLGILLMYMVMAAQFESFKQPLIILFTVPLAIIGVVLALFITGSSLSVIGCIGILMLIGIIVNNAIVLIDFVNTLRKEKPDISIDDALIESSLTRIRPILMTSLTSILGFLPMALSRASGSEMMRPLAVVLIGGLFVGTLLTLFVIPAVYKIFEILSNRALKRTK